MLFLGEDSSLFQTDPRGTIKSQLVPDSTVAMKTSIPREEISIESFPIRICLMLLPLPRVPRLLNGFLLGVPRVVL